LACNYEANVESNTLPKYNHGLLPKQLLTGWLANKIQSRYFREDFDQTLVLEMASNQNQSYAFIYICLFR
jgi:hypothetical protein